MVSDFDLLGILYRQKTQEVFFHEKRGFLTNQDLEVIEEINLKFQKKILSLFHFIDHEFQLISHGPYNRFPAAKSSCFQNYLKIYDPFGYVVHLEEKDSVEARLHSFNTALKALEEKGYHLEKNQNREAIL